MDLSKQIHSPFKKQPQLFFVGESPLKYQEKIQKKTNC